MKSIHRMEDYVAVKKKKEMSSHSVSSVQGHMLTVCY